MKFATLLSIMTLLIAGCSTGRSNEPTPADKINIPAVTGYTKAEQKQAAAERKQYCSVVPMLCRMINDYGRMRDEARVAMGLKVDTSR